jgi:gamma-glutamyl:cysteine ligase YbdK (ATP-grasp superfamily)
MGIEITQTSFSVEQEQQFNSKLNQNLSSLQSLLAQPGFGVGPASLGAELEIYIVDEDGFPLPINEKLLKLADDPQLTLELNRYNLEYNLSPYNINELAFFRTEREIIDKLHALSCIACLEGGRVVPIGILPTLRRSDFGPQSMTPRKRYAALVEQLIRRRGSEFSIDINGDQPLQMSMSDITLEGANTSFQVHYRVLPENFADTFNAIQLVTPLVLAIAGNSPTLFGHSLWQETRIPLFKQSIDTRQLHRYNWHEPARVNYGHGWVRDDALELFAESVRLYPSLLPVCSGVNDQEAAAPRLAELRLHQSTVWLWNRPVYDDVAGGQLRIEMRALPAGPTAVDMVANAAFAIGLAEGLRPQINELLPALPFSIAEYNFYRAAQHGMQAELVWPDPRQRQLAPRPVLEIIEALMDVAAEGLAGIGVSEAEVTYYLDIIRARLASRQTGATWQLDRLQQLARGNNM